MASRRATRRVLAVSSGGGHWTELLRVRPALQEFDAAWVTVRRSYERDVSGARFYAIRDATRWSKLALLVMAVQLAVIMLRERPDVVVSTGAAPGYAAIRLGRWLGARTVWLDSMANVDELSMSGRIVGPYADLWLTQWSHLAGPDGPEFAGAVL
jgi:UDP-N-acetylglucosamine:LPS N-acetylglucosamine transferase